jgi:heptosyltransferase-2
MIPVAPASTRRILVRANNWIGDVVLISPAVRALREHFPDARLAILGKRWVLEALSGNPFFDDLIEYDRQGRHAGLAGRLRLAAELRRGGRIDLAILFQKAFDAAAIAWMSGARQRVGYATDGRRALLTEALPLPPAGTHHAEIFLALARAVGCPVRDARPFFHLSARDRDDAQAVLRRAGLAGARPLAALHAGASKPARAWHLERFAELGRRLNARLGARLILLGGPDEPRRMERLAAGLPSGSFLIPDPSSGLRASAAILERCHLFVGNDSGPMHLAAALDVPTLGIFGPGHPRTTGPVARGANVVTVGRDYPCSPCRQDFFRECSPAPSGKPFCLEEVDIGTVEQAATELLQGAVVVGDHPWDVVPR